MSKIKSEHKEFIKRLALEGLSTDKIKEELVKVHKNDVPCSRYISELKARYIAVARGKAYEPSSSSGRVLHEKYRTLIENGVKQGKTRLEITREIWEKYGKNSVCKSSVRRWFHRFKDVVQTVKHKTHQPNQTRPESRSEQRDQEKQNSNCELQSKSCWYKFVWTNIAAIDLCKIFFF